LASVIPSPFTAALIDPTAMFANALGAITFSLLLWLVLTFLVILATYWLIRLAVRHGTMDTARWQAAGMPSRGSWHVQPASAPSAVLAPAAVPPRRSSSGDGVPVPPRDALEW
jgi:hypothetical protein